MKDIFLLDMDETLLDFKRTERENFFATLQKFGVKADERIFERFHEINDGLWKALERGETTREKLVVTRFEILFAEINVTGVDIAALSAAFFANYTEICHPFAGAAEFVKTLSERGRVYIVTNGAGFIQKRHIADAGFAPYLRGAFISEEIGFNKPDLRFAQAVEAGVEGYARERAVWIGDSLTSDCACAKNAGIDFILYAPHGAPKGYCGAVAKNYSEVLAILGHLNT